MLWILNKDVKIQGESIYNMTPSLQTSPYLQIQMEDFVLFLCKNTKKCAEIYLQCDYFFVSCQILNFHPVVRVRR